MASDPLINVNVYVTADEEIDVDVCECDLNPIWVRVGSQYRTNAMGIGLSIPQAEKLLAGLRAALTDQYIIAHGDDATVADAEVPAPVVRVAE